MHGHHHHHHHGHSHGADGRHHDHTTEWLAATKDHRALILALVLNFALVIGEYVFGYLADSLALMADASHNLSDCMALLLAWVAMRLAQRRPDTRFTYGFGSSTILVSLINGIILLGIGAFLGYEAFESLGEFMGEGHDHHHEISTHIMVWVALAAMLLNGLTAWLFHRSQAKDLNLKGVYIHMIVDAAVSLGVVVAALGIDVTGWKWIDPAFTLVIVAALFYATYSLVVEGVRLLLQAVPQQVNATRVREYLLSLDGVTAVHDFHVWALSTREVAMTAHLVMPAGHPGDAFLASVSADVAEKFGIVHSTLQIEVSPHAVPCALDGHGHG